ncbi:tyrosine-type recombinase/integrase [Leucobacter sp.]
MKNTRQIPEAWQAPVSRYLTALRAGGHPETTIDTRRQHLHYLARRIGVPPSQVDRDLLIEWCAEQNWAPESRRGRTNTYRSFWKWAKKAEGWRNVAKHLPRVKTLPGVPRPTPDRIYLKAILHADVRTRLILRLAGECGLRRGEIAHIHTVNDLMNDLIGWSLLVHGKGGRDRVVPLPDGIALELLDLPEGWAFPGRINGHLSPRRIGELATEVLDGEWTLHTIRHRFATRTYSIDHDVFAVQDLLGHASAETTRRYVARDSRRLRTLVQRAAGRLPDEGRLATGHEILRRPLVTARI